MCLFLDYDWMLDYLTIRNLAMYTQCWVVWVCACVQPPHYPGIWLFIFYINCVKKGLRCHNVLYNGTRRVSIKTRTPTGTCSWWRHQMEAFSALLAIGAGNSPVPGEFHAQRPVTRSFAFYFDLCPNKRLIKQAWGWWFGTQSRPLWRHRNVTDVYNFPGRY